MHIFGTIVIGIVVGIVFRLVTSGNGSSGLVLTVVLGIVGAVAATYVGQAFGVYHEGQTAGFLGALVGAVVLLAVYHVVVRKKTY